MKKPDFIKIKLPAELKYFKTAVVKYFNTLVDQDVCLDFSETRHRKNFKYRVVAAEPKRWYTLGNQKKCTGEIELILIKQ